MVPSSGSLWMGISVSFSTVSPKGCSLFWGNRRIHLVGFSWLQGPSRVTLLLDGRVPRVEGDILPNCGAPSCCSWAPPLGGPWTASHPEVPLVHHRANAGGAISACSSSGSEFGHLCAWLPVSRGPSSCIAMVHCSGPQSLGCE